MSQFSLEFYVHDRAQMYMAAMDRAQKDGLPEQDARNLLCPDGEISISSCMIMATGEPHVSNALEKCESCVWHGKHVCDGSCTARDRMIRAGLITMAAQMKARQPLPPEASALMSKHVDRPLSRQDVQALLLRMENHTPR